MADKEIKELTKELKNINRTLKQIRDLLKDEELDGQITDEEVRKGIL